MIKYIMFIGLGDKGGQDFEAMIIWKLVSELFSSNLRSRSCVRKLSVVFNRIIAKIKRLHGLQKTHGLLGYD